MNGQQYPNFPHFPDRNALLHGRDMIVVFREPVKPPRPGPGQPGLHSNWLPQEPELFIALLANGLIMAFNGHVDYGTGIKTALTQIVAEELDVPLDRVTMVLGHARATPNQGPTIASASIQVSAVPSRHAAAQVRQWLIKQGYVTAP